MHVATTLPTGEEETSRKKYFKKIPRVPRPPPVSPYNVRRYFPTVSRTMKMYRKAPPTARRQGASLGWSSSGVTLGLRGCFCSFVLDAYPTPTPHLVFSGTRIRMHSTCMHLSSPILPPCSSPFRATLLYLESHRRSSIAVFVATICAAALPYTGIRATAVMGT